jgi:hypothetical protein
MSTHHCCDPEHAQTAERIRRLVARLQEAETRAKWAETMETVMARTVERMRDRLAEAGIDPDSENRATATR